MFKFGFFPPAAATAEERQQQQQPGTGAEAHNDATADAWRAGVDVHREEHAAQRIVGEVHEEGEWM